MCLNDFLTGLDWTLIFCVIFYRSWISQNVSKFWPTKSFQYYERFFYKKMNKRHIKIRVSVHLSIYHLRHEHCRFNRFQQMPPQRWKKHGTLGACCNVRVPVWIDSKLPDPFLQSAVKCRKPFIDNPKLDEQNLLRILNVIFLEKCQIIFFILKIVHFLHFKNVQFWNFFYQNI